MPYSKIFEKENCYFFDDLVSYLATLTSLGIALHGYEYGYTRPYKKNESITLYGNRGVTNLELRFSPYSMMKEIASNSWPKKIIFAALELPDKTSFDPGNEHPNEVIHSKVDGVLAFQIQGGFIRYFETYRSIIEENHGTDVWKWPQVWLFAWMTRNAFAHGGKIDIRKKNSPDIIWKSLCYNDTDNGTNLLHNSLGIVEIIILLEEMDIILRKYT